MDAMRIINYKNGLNNIKGKISALNAKVKELEELELEKDDILDKCNHELILVYGNSERKVGTVKVGYCLICDEPVDIIWKDYYLKKDMFDVESIIDVSDIIHDFDHDNLDEEDISNIVCQRIKEVVKHARVMFDEYICTSLINKEELNREEIKKGIREEIERLNKNSVKVKKLK